MECHRRAGEARQADALRARQKGGPRSDHLQQIQAHHAGRASALAVHRIGAKALAATGTKVDTFVKLITDSGKAAISNVPLIGFAEAGAGGYFDDGGFPVGKGWEEIAFPSVTDEHAYALEISGDLMKPAYRDGDVIVVSPAAPVRRGDRVVVKTKDGEVMVKELKRKTSKSVELKSLNAEHRDRTLPMSEVVWVARIVWASQ